MAKAIEKNRERMRKTLDVESFDVDFTLLLSMDKPAIEQKTS
jgi:hypothetical protein